MADTRKGILKIVGVGERILKEEKKVSVVIPCHNAAKYLPQCFISLVKQTIGMHALELIFIDDASDDDGATWEMLQEMERAYPESIAVIHLEENMRQGGARNIGMRYATGEYLAFVDADDWVEEDFLERTYYTAKEENADIVQFGHKVYTDTVGEIETLGKQYRPENIFIQSDTQRKEMLMAEKVTYGCWNKIYRRKLVETAGVSYAEHVIYEEPLFVYPLLFYAERIVIIAEQFYNYRQNFKGTMHSDMKAQESLMQHASVQMQTWNFMKCTPFFERFYEEIKFYFFHTYFYETLFFAGRRHMKLKLEYYQTLCEGVRKELEIPVESIYFECFPVQGELAERMSGNMTQEELEQYLEKIAG